MFSKIHSGEPMDFEQWLLENLLWLKGIIDVLVFVENGIL